MIGERYRLIRLLGEGGHGRVFEAVDDYTATRVALKLVRDEHAGVDAIERLRRESEANSRVTHPGVARIVAVDATGDDVYVVMELVDGPTLRSFRGQTSLSRERLRDLFVAILDAAAEVHRAGLVHRDLKPSNVGIAVGADGELLPKLLDFGLARAIDGDAGTTTSGRILGTPHYMSPEQALGESSRDPRVDVWSLGVMLYECVEGVRPYDGPTPTAVLMNVLRRVPRSMRRVHPRSALGRVIRTAIARDPARRFRDAGELRDALVRALDRPEDGTERVGERWIAAVGVVVIAALAYAGWASFARPNVEIADGSVAATNADLRDRALPGDRSSPLAAPAPVEVQSASVARGSSSTDARGAVDPQAPSAAQSRRVRARSPARRPRADDAPSTSTTSSPPDRPTDAPEASAPGLLRRY